MFGLIILLVLPFNVCEAYVDGLTQTKPEDFKINRQNYDPEIFCGSQGGLIECYTLEKERSFMIPEYAGSYEWMAGHAVGVIYGKADCSLDTLPGETKKSYVFLDSCDEITNLNVENEGMTVEVLLASKKWTYCTEHLCRKYQDPQIDPPTTWTHLQKPRKIKSASGRSDTMQKREDDSEESEDEQNQRARGRSKTMQGDDGEESENQQLSNDACDRRYSCTSCSTGRVCAPRKGTKQLYEIARFSCTDMFPYCDYTTGSCSKDVDPSCVTKLPNEEKSSEFLCMRDGFFPDPASCSKYYSCVDFIPYEHECPKYPTPYYNPDLQHCVLTPTFCVQPSSEECKEQKNAGTKIRVAYTTGLNFMCGNQGISGSHVEVVDKCPGAYHFINGKCKFECPHPGLFLYAGNCYMYYKCTYIKVEKRYKMEVKTCPDGEAFSAKAYQCVDENEVPYCTSCPFDAEIHQ